MKGLYFLIRKPGVRYGAGWIADCYIVGMRSAAVAIGLDEASILAAVEEHGRCDTDTHILVPVDGIS